MTVSPTAQVDQPVDPGQLGRAQPHARPRPRALPRVVTVLGGARHTHTHAVYTRDLQQDILLFRRSASRTLTLTSSIGQHLIPLNASATPHV